MKNLYNFLYIAFCFSFLVLSKQSYSQDKPNPKEIDEIREQSLNIVYTFDRYISRIATSSAAGATNVDLLIYRAMDLFIDSTKVVEVSNEKANTLHKYRIKQYLFLVANYKKRFAVVDFEAIPYKNINLKAKIVNGVVIGYEATVKYRQVFKVKKDISIIMEGKPEKKDWDIIEFTDKEVKVFIKKIVDENNQTIWIIKLGDIKVISTTTK